MLGFCLYREGNFMEWIKIKDKHPEGKEPFLAYDSGLNYYAIGLVNWLHGLHEKEGVYMPARHGEGMQVTHWKPLIPPKEE